MIVIAERLTHALILFATLSIAGCATHHLTVDDAMEFEDGRTRFVAYAGREHGPLYGGVEGVDVQFTIDGRAVATARSNERGIAMVVASADLGTTSFEATATFGGEDFRREGNVVQWRSDRTLIACDIDATISDTSLEALFFEEVDEKSKPISGSVEALHEIARHYDLIYFTARPRFTLQKTRDWLATHGYPTAPVLTSLTASDAIAETRYKRREIRKLREIFPNLLIGIGNSKIDSQGYGANGMLALIVNRPDQTRYDSHVVEFHDWRQLGSFLDVNRDVLQDPVRAQAAVRGEAMLLVPVLPWISSSEQK
jgi:hypothetical protein